MDDDPHRKTEVYPLKLHLDAEKDLQEQGPKERKVVQCLVPDCRNTFIDPPYEPMLCWACRPLWMIAEVWEAGEFKKMAVRKPSSMQLKADRLE